jgi:hypothetical protein
MAVDHCWFVRVHVAVVGEVQAEGAVVQKRILSQAIIF